MVEFVLITPLILLLTLIALDFGRVYLGYINLQNMARVAANFAANNPGDSGETWTSQDADVKTQYQNQIADDAEATNCQLPGGIAPDPQFLDADGDGIANGQGDLAKVGLTCAFGVITPFVSNIVGSSLNVSAEVTFPVKAGMSSTGAGGGGGCYDPPVAAINTAPATTGQAPYTVTLTDASGGCPGTAWLWSFDDGTATSPDQDPPAHTFTIADTYTVSLTVWNALGFDTVTQDIVVSALVTPPPTCTVPNYTAGGGVQRSLAQGMWNAAGFTTTVNPTTGNWKIKSQSLVGGSVVACDATITVSNH